MSTKTTDLDNVFVELRKVFTPFAKRLEVKTDTESTYYLDSRVTGDNGKPMFFGSVAVKKKFVSFHLMPVYVNPALLDDIRHELPAIPHLASRRGPRMGGRGFDPFPL